MKAWLKEAMRRRGLHVFTDGSLPHGVDWIADIRRQPDLRDDPVCLDVGANVGQTAVELLAAFPRGRVHSFEPFSEPLARLRSVAARNPGIRVVPLAMGSTEATLSVHPAESSVFSSITGRPRSNGDPRLAPRAETIRVDTLDAYCAGAGVTRVDILKTDTEGHDLEVLRGAAGMLRAGRIGYVCAEVTFLSTNLHNTPFRPVFDFLDDAGFEFLGTYETYSMHRFPPPNHFCNALFRRRSHQ